MDIIFSRDPDAAPEATPYTIIVRKPLSTDGFGVHQLIDKCKPLDTNSVYCNLLQCHHFSDTCRLAETDGQIAGFVSGYALPDKPETLFIWQVAINADFRGNGLGKILISDILAEKQFSQLNTTITEDNQSSWQLFRGIASYYKANLTSQILFERQNHFGEQHDSELLVTIDFPEAVQQPITRSPK